MIDRMFQEGTDRALDDQVARPVLRPQPSPKFSLLSTAGRGPAVGTALGLMDAGAFATEVAGAFGQAAERFSYSLLPENTENQRAYKAAGQAKAIDWSSTDADYIRTKANDIMPDPNTTHESEQIVAGLFRFAVKGIGYTLLAGPYAGAALLGGDAGLTEADRLKAQGVDLDTRTKAGAVAGTIAGASMLVPMTGPSALYRFGVGSTAGAAGVIGQAAAEREILRAAGYDHLADTFDPLELKALGIGSLAPGLLGAAFGKAGPVIPKRAPLKPSEGGAAWDEANAATRAQELSPDRLGVLRQELANPATPAAERARLQAHIDAIEAQGAIRGEPDAAPAVRVAQAARAIEDSRPPALDTLAGRDAHVSAVELAADQIGRGEPVNVGNVLDIGERIETLPEFLARSKFPEDPVMKPVEGQFIRWLRENGGISLAEKFDITGEKNAFRLNPGGIFRRVGVTTDELALRAAHEGYLRPDQQGDTAAFVDLVKRAVNGEKVLNFEEQMQDAARRGAEADAAARLAAVSDRLQLLGIDTTPANGNYRALEAFAREHEPRLLRSAVDELARVTREEQGMPEADALLKKAKQTADDIMQSDRTLAQWEQEIGQLSPVMRRLVGQQLERARNGDAAPSANGSSGSQLSQTTGSADRTSVAFGSVEDVGIASAADEVVRLNPELLVQLDGMDAPVKVGELLAAVKEEAARDAELAHLVAVAARCAMAV